MDLQPILPVEFDRAWNTGQIGLKFTEITLYASLVKLGIIPINSTGIYQWIYSQFDRSNFKFDQAWNTGQIGWKFIVCLPGRSGYHPNEFN